MSFLTSRSHAARQGFGKPVVAPSANVSGHVSTTTAQHVETDLAGKIDLIHVSSPFPIVITPAWDETVLPG